MCSVMRRAALRYDAVRCCGSVLRCGAAVRCGAVGHGAPGCLREVGGDGGRWDGMGCGDGVVRWCGGVWCLGWVWYGMVWFGGSWCAVRYGVKLFVDIVLRCAVWWSGVGMGGAGWVVWGEAKRSGTLCCVVLCSVV